jgi:hypothetical protein
MKNIFKFLGIIAMVAVIGFGVSCASDDEDEDSVSTSTATNTGGGDPLIAEWYANAECTTLYVEIKTGGKAIQGGTGLEWDYVISGSTISFTYNSIPMMTWNNYSISGKQLTYKLDAATETSTIYKK